MINLSTSSRDKSAHIHQDISCLTCEGWKSVWQADKLMTTSNFAQKVVVFVHPVLTASTTGRLTDYSVDRKLAANHSDDLNQWKLAKNVPEYWTANLKICSKVHLTIKSKQLTTTIMGLKHCGGEKHKRESMLWTEVQHLVRKCPRAQVLLWSSSRKS